MTRIAVVTLLGLLASGLPAEATEDALGQNLVRQLSCLNDPDATVALLHLEKTGRIGDNDGDRNDGETCWFMKPALKIEGVVFTRICATADDDALMVEMFPKFYYRGPGRPNGRLMRLTSKASVPALRSWAKKVLGNGPYEVGSSGREDDEKGISCAASSRRQ
ncbi:hypothetical protein MAUB1S_07839 [Mycolicibacterium aubagnense]